MMLRKDHDKSASSKVDDTIVAQVQEWSAALALDWLSTVSVTVIKTYPICRRLLLNSQPDVPDLGVRTNETVQRTE